jgi:hypothetical protein
MEDLIRTTLKDTSFKGELIEQEEIVQAVVSLTLEFESVMAKISNNQVPFVLPSWS